jgi:DNA-binding transcriptional LysR family regulator
MYKKSKVEQLRALCCVIENHSVVKAAKALNISPPSVTAYIKSFEKIIGVNLFTRERRKLIPTDLCMQIYQQALNAISQIDYLYNDIPNEINDKSYSKLRVAASPLTIKAVLPHVLSAIYSKRPNSDIVIKEIDYQDAVDSLQENQIDAFIYPLNTEMIREQEVNLLYEKLFNYKLTVFAHQDNKINSIASENITFDDIFANKLIRFTKSHSVIAGVNESQLNKVRRLSNIVCSPYALEATILTNKGLTFVDRNFINIMNCSKDIRINEIPAYHLSRDVYFYIVTLKNNRSDILKLFRKEIKNYTLKYQ